MRPITSLFCPPPTGPPLVVIYGAGLCVMLMAVAVSFPTDAQPPAERVTSSFTTERRKPRQELAAEYTRVEILGKLNVSPDAVGEWLLTSQDRPWKLELGRDRLLLFVAPRLQGESVLVTGRLRVTDGKLNAVQVARIEPAELHRARD